ncbi:MAG: hypothetical protein HUU38_18325 [Anaerolineales bacterium]|nr:hypothetical protein [Anaerolineales bacterium]
MNTRTKLLLAAILFLLPFALRWAWFNRPMGEYTPPEIPQLDQVTVTVSETNFEPIQDRPQPGNGRVVADLTHFNNLLTDDLTPLSERLAARGVELELLNDFTALESTLRGATAFVIAAPTYPFDAYERGVIEAFVKDGGKLLLIADPTRQVPIPEEELLFNPFAVFFPESAVPVINSLSSAFGLIYFDDYLYDLASTEGNYRNVRYADLASSPLTANVDELVLFAAHSLRGGTPLLTGTEDVLSNKRTGETTLSPAMLATEGNVVALGDLTLLTAPYHTVAGNDQFLSNLSDWLVEDGRTWNLADFPYLFDDTVTYVQLKQADVDPRLLVFGSTLQATLGEADIQLTASNILSPTQDAVLAGTYLEHELLTNILHSAGVTITLTFSETEEDTAPTLADLQEGKLSITGLGTLDIQGTTLYLEYPIGTDETGVVVLVRDEADLTTALENLIFGLPTGCLEHGPLIICSTGEVNGAPPSSGGSNGPEEEFGYPPPDEGGNGPAADAPSIFILALDTGPDGVLTSAYDLQFYLGSIYNVTVWSLEGQGIPVEADVSGYDLYIIDAGDYAFDLPTYESLEALGNINAPTWLMGAQPLFASDTEPLIEVEIANLDHPIVAGLTETLIPLSESLSGVPEQLFRPEDFSDTDGTTAIVLTRGPGNATPGGPVLFAGDDGLSPRTVIAALAYYRLPFDVQETLALNIVGWLLGEG